MSKRNKQITLFACLVVMALTAAIFTGKLSGTEYAAAIGGLIAVVTMLVQMGTRKSKS